MTADTRQTVGTCVARHFGSGGRVGKGQRARAEDAMLFTVCSAASAVQRGSFAVTPLRVK